MGLFADRAVARKLKSRSSQHCSVAVFSSRLSSSKEVWSGEKMEDHTRGDSDQRDPVLIDEALELRFCVCLVGKITFSG